VHCLWVNAATVKLAARPTSLFITVAKGFPAAIYTFNLHQQRGTVAL
jgi:hypothetical protein